MNHGREVREGLTGFVDDEEREDDHVVACSWDLKLVLREGFFSEV